MALKSWAVLDVRISPPGDSRTPDAGLVDEATKILETGPTRDVERDRTDLRDVVQGNAKLKIRATDAQALHEYVSKLVDSAYRAGRRANLGGRGNLGLRAGIAIGETEHSNDVLFRAFQLSQAADTNTILAEEAFVAALDPLSALPFDRDASRHVDGRLAYQTFAPDQRDCFVVMPMGEPESEIRDRSETILDKLVRPACRSLRLRPVAPTRQAGAKVSMDVFGSLHSSHVTVAYLGGHPWNPNVMIEVGYRLALERPLVLIADEKPPFDLEDDRVVLVPRDRPLDVDAKLTELVESIRNRLADYIEGSDLFPTAEIEVDERNVPDDHKRHRVVAASEETARLFGLERSVLIGMAPSDLIAHLSDLIADPFQFDAFNAEQERLYQQLSRAPIHGSQSSPRTVTATVPITLFSHPKPEYNCRAFLPCLISQTRKPRAQCSTQLVVYVEVTQAVRRKGKVNVCELQRANTNLAFELYANSYDVILPRLENYVQVRDRHVSAVTAACERRNGTAKALDVGAGTGNVTIPLVDKGIEVWALDRSQAMLQCLARKLGNRQGCRQRLEDCRSLRSFQDSTFDAVTMSLVLFAMGTKDGAESALHEAARVLKPGGVIVITEPTSNFELLPLVREAEAELQKQADWHELRPHWDVVSRANSIIDPQNNEFIPAEDIANWLRGRHFTISETCDAYRGNCWTITATKPGASQ